MIEAPKASRREIFGWSMFDFANQAYTLLIISVIFGDLYVRVIVGGAPDHRLGNLLWSAALCLSHAIVVITAPLLGAIMDATRTRKKMLFASYVLTVISTALLYFVEPGALWLGFLLIVVSNAAYATGESIIASFLPFLGPSRDLGRISGLGWATGYAGGLVAAGDDQSKVRFESGSNLTYIKDFFGRGEEAVVFGGGLSIRHWYLR